MFMMFDLTQAVRYLFNILQYCTHRAALYDKFISCGIYLQNVYRRSGVDFRDIQVERAPKKPHRSVFYILSEASAFLRLFKFHHW